jgi:hypothetical protein
VREGAVSDITAVLPAEAQAAAAAACEPEALADQPCDPHYRPGAWVPHVTLAKGGGAGAPGWMGRALEVLAPLCPALRPGRAERLDLVHFRPVTVLQSHPLPSGLAHAAASV